MNNYELHMKTHTCHDECQNPVCVAVREAVAAEREANKDRIETLYQMYKMASQQRDELMQQQVKALRARLAQPEQEHSEQWWRHEVSNAWAEGYEKGRASVKQPEQEPVWVEVTTNTGDKFILDSAVEADKIRAARDAGLLVVPLYTAPPQREWQGLTMEEMDALVEEQSGFPVEMVGHVLICAAQAKLKEKNHAV